MSREHMRGMHTTAVVSAILEKEEAGKKLVYIQTRWKPTTSPRYSGLIEIPAGVIDGYEGILEALRREVKEETGLVVSRIIGSHIGPVEENILNERTQVFQPFICQQSLETVDGLPWVSFVFRCEIQGTMNVNEKEAKSPRWLTIAELDQMLKQHPQDFFPLQYAVLRYYVMAMR